MSAHTSAFESVTDLAARFDVLASQVQQTADAAESAPVPTPSEVGRIVLYASAPPATWVRCDGSDLAKAEYADLYANVGAAFNQPGDPDDSTWDRFRVPNLASVQHQDGQTPSTGPELQYFVASQ